MKKIILAAGVLAAMTAVSCSENQKADNALATKTTTDSTSAAAACNIRYMDLQKVYENYTLSKELNLELQKEQLAIENQARQKQADLQQRGASVQNKYQNNGYLSQASLEADMQDLQKREEAANQWLNTHSNRIASMGAEIQMRIADSIKSFVNDYIKVYGYDAIMIEGQAGFFKPELDVTNDIIEGLNARYQATAPAEKK
ncbi:MAG: OmpH family outer membrane protein [Muribaculaceae bacterium]|nr:OmpH family outer membrane protein [Muribaculaceae bacterium]